MRVGVSFAGVVRREHGHLRRSFYVHTLILRHRFGREEGAACAAEGADEAACVFPGEAFAPVTESAGASTSVPEAGSGDGAASIAFPKSVCGSSIASTVGG